MLWQNLWLVDTEIVRNCSPPEGKASENLLNNPCLEKSQTISIVKTRHEWDYIIVRMKPHITKRLCYVRHLVCTYFIWPWLKRKTFFEGYFVVFQHDYIAYSMYFLKINYSCIINIVSSMYSNMPTYFKFDKECIDSIVVTLNIYL